LLEENEDKCHLVFLWQVFESRFFDFLDVQVKIFVWLQDVRLTMEDVVEELCEKQGSSLVLLLRLTELRLQTLMFLEESIVLLLLDNHVSLLLFKLLFQEVDQVIATLCHIVVTGEPWHHTIRLAQTAATRSEVCLISTFGTLCVHSRSVLQLLLQSLDNFLAEVGALSKLFLDFFMDFNLALVGLDLLLHLVVLKDEDLRLLRLVLELGRKLVILQNGQVSRGLQLLIIHGKQIGLGLLNVKKHFFAQLLSFLNAIKLLLIDLFQSGSFLDFKIFL